MHDLRDLIGPSCTDILTPLVRRSFIVCKSSSGPGRLSQSSTLKSIRPALLFHEEEVVACKSATTISLSLRYAIELSVLRMEVFACFGPCFIGLSICMDVRATPLSVCWLMGLPTRNCSYVTAFGWVVANSTGGGHPN